MPSGPEVEKDFLFSEIPVHHRTPDVFSGKIFRAGGFVVSHLLRIGTFHLATWFMVTAEVESFFPIPEPRTDQEISTAYGWNVFSVRFTFHGYHLALFPATMSFLSQLTPAPGVERFFLCPESLIYQRFPETYQWKDFSVHCVTFRLP